MTSLSSFLLLSFFSLGAWGHTHKAVVSELITDKSDLLLNLAKVRLDKSSAQLPPRHLAATRNVSLNLRDLVADRPGSCIRAVGSHAWQRALPDG